MADKPFYSTKSVNAGSSIKTGMIRVSIDEAEPVVETDKSMTKSQRLVMTGLADPIEIVIPYTGSIKSKYTLSCVYSEKLGDTISSKGLVTVMQADSCK